MELKMQQHIEAIGGVDETFLIIEGMFNDCAEANGCDGCPSREGCVKLWDEFVACSTGFTPRRREFLRQQFNRVRQVRFEV